MYIVSLSSLPSYHIFHRIDHQEQTWAHIIMIIIIRRKRNIMKSQVNIYIVPTAKPIIKNGKRMLQRAVNRIHNQTRPRQNHDLPKHICSQRMLLNRKIQFYKEYFASNGNSHEMFTQHIVILNLILPSCKRYIVDFFPKCKYVGINVWIQSPVCSIFSVLGRQMCSTLFQNI